MCTHECKGRESNFSLADMPNYVKLKFLSIDYKCKHLINSSSYQKHVEHGQLGSLWFDNWAVYRSHHSLVLGLYISAFLRGGGRRMEEELL
jgi:hypothetical protein